jgi:competence protein ComEC
MPLIVIFCLGWMVGLWAADWLDQPWWAWLLASGIAAVGLYRLRARPTLRLLCAGLICLGLGGLRYQLTRPPIGDSAFVASYNDIGQITLEGVVWDAPDVRDTRANLRVRVESLWLPEAAAPVSINGLVLVYAPRLSAERLAATGDGEFHYGDRVQVRGQLETPPQFEDFSYRDYLARQEVYSQIRFARVEFLAARQGHPLWQALYDFKAHALSVLARLFPEPHAALLSGILLGVEAGIPTHLKEAFSATGTSHIVAISGFNISILVGVFTAIAYQLFGVRRGTLVTLVGVATYAVLAGASASVVRAAIMGSLALIAQRLGRQTAGLNSLSAAVLFMTLLNPLTLWDVGFQLSAAATLGLILYAEPLQLGFKNLLARFLAPAAVERVAGLLGEGLLLTFAAQITTLPLMAYYFRTVSLVSLVANVVIIPVQPAVMVLSGIALLLGLIALPLGQIAAWAAWPFTAYTIAFVQLFAQAPSASIGLGDVVPWFIGILYAVLFGLTWLWRQPPEQRPAWWSSFAANGLPLTGLAGLTIGAALAWSSYFSLPEGRLRVTVLDVGQGDAILIQTPGGTRVLIDGGPSGGRLTRALVRELPLFANQLDLLVIAAPRDENLGGLPDVLQRYTLGRAVVTSAPGKSATYQAVRQALADHETEIVDAADLPSFDLGEGVVLKVLADGEKGSALRLEWGSFSVLLPIGLDLAGESALMMRGLAQPATALLLADHGSDEATQENWVWAVNPQVVFVSTAAGSGSPSPEVLNRLAGRTLLRTDQHGSLTLTTDGQQVWVETER